MAADRVKPHVSKIIPQQVQHVLRRTGPVEAQRTSGIEEAVAWIKVLYGNVFSDRGGRASGAEERADTAVDTGGPATLILTVAAFNRLDWTGGGTDAVHDTGVPGLMGKPVFPTGHDGGSSLERVGVHMNSSRNAG